MMDKWVDSRHTIDLITSRCNKNYETGQAEDPSKEFLYKDLLNALLKLTEEQLNQKVKILPPNGNKLHNYHLEPVIGINTVEYYCHIDGEVITQTRTCEDFQHHPEQVVLLRDGSGVGEYGDTLYRSHPDAPFITQGNVSKKWFDLDEEIPLEKLEEEVEKHKKEIEDHKKRYKNVQIDGSCCEIDLESDRSEEEQIADYRKWFATRKRR